MACPSGPLFFIGYGFLCLRGSLGAAMLRPYEKNAPPRAGRSRLCGCPDARGAAIFYFTFLAKLSLSPTTRLNTGSSAVES